jgi:NAD(P)H dehydrogenase (quinone)
MFVAHVLSSHYPGSQADRLMRAFDEKCRELGHETHVFDLYQMGFNPILAGEDFNQFKGEPLPEDIQAIHKVLEKADVLTFFYPVWWTDMPAIMKGFIDRVLAKGFAYEFDENGKTGTMPLDKILLVCTLGNQRDESAIEMEKVMVAKEKVGVFEFVGVHDVTHHFVYAGDDPAKAEAEEVVALAAFAESL